MLWIYGILIVCLVGDPRKQCATRETENLYCMSLLWVPIYLLLFLFNEVVLHLLLILLSRRHGKSPFGANDFIEQFRELIGYRALGMSSTRWASMLGCGRSGRDWICWGLLHREYSQTQPLNANSMQLKANLLVSWNGCEIIDCGSNFGDDGDGASGLPFLRSHSCSNVQLLHLLQAH